MSAKKGPQEGPKRPPIGAPKRSQVENDEKLNNMCCPKENQFFLLPPKGHPNGAHMGPKSLSERASVSKSMKIESERAPRGLRGRKNSKMGS